MEDNKLEREYLVKETWQTWVTVTANSPKEAEKLGAKLLHEGKADDCEYIGEDDDGVYDAETDEFWSNDALNELEEE